MNTVRLSSSPPHGQQTHALARLLSARRAALIGGLSGLLAWAVVVAPARAADRVYWANFDPHEISFANLDGSAGGNLATTGATATIAEGIALDPAAGRVYFVGAAGIAFANLDGSGGGDLATGDATVATPSGVAIDPAAGRIYWANVDASKISFANLNGSGGGDLSTAGATVNHPSGVAIDPAAGRIYWANALGNKISFASLNGSGGEDLSTGAATVNDPSGVAIDRSARAVTASAGRIYWANQGADKISFANLNGTGGGDLTISGATVGSPQGVAIDDAAGRIYWGNLAVDMISFANLDGTAGGEVVTPDASEQLPSWPVLLESPRGAGAPVITGGSAVGSTLNCSQASWAADLTPSFLYRAPRNFASQWSISTNGTDSFNAFANPLTASVAGTYRCTVTASNQAGSASQSSAPYPIASPTSPPASPGSSASTGPAAGPTSGASTVLAFGAQALVTLKLATKRIRAPRALTVQIANANSFVVTGKLSGRSVNPPAAGRRRRVNLKFVEFTVAPHANAMVTLTLPPVLRRLLTRRRELSLQLTATVRDPAQHNRVVSTRVRLKLKPGAR
jgi:DNA-binding beta-propeller fold protein YncE